VQELAQNAVNGLALGSLYALIALGMALIFGIMRLVNFAHGELLTIGGYFLVLAAGAPWPVLLAASLVVVAVFAIGMEKAAFRPVRTADAPTLLVTSFAVSFFLQNLAMLVFGPLPKTTTVSQALIEPFEIGFLSIPRRDVLTIVATFALLAVLGMFLTRTRLGVQMRAAAEDFRMARVLGVRVNTVIATAFAISGLAAALAAFVLVAQTGTVSPTMGLSPVLVGFVAMVLGGMGSLRGAVLGGFVLGMVTVALQSYLPLEMRYYRDAFAYTAVILVLLIRPQGLIVARSETQRV
jgi:branched-chain amino acid transport system permease protein